MQQFLAKISNGVLILLAVIGLAMAVQLPLTWTYQAILGVLLIIVSILTGRLATGRSATLLLTFVSFFCTARYTYWRWASTLRYLNNNGWSVDKWGLVFGFLLLSAEGYAVLILLLGYFQSARPLKRRPVPMPADDSEWPTVDVFIPTYNEPLEVVRPTVLAALAIDWPADKLRVHLLDDGRRDEFKDFAEECSVSYVTRSDNAHAKAGNINNALAQTDAEYVAIFDCDHIATRSFLQMTVGWFLKDRRLGLLQTPHHFYSPDPFERNLGVFRKVPNEGSLFYGIVQQGSDLWNATFFCGSCAVLRRTALEEIGGIAVETVTEDAHTSLRMQRRGWNTAYIGIPQAAGLATGSLAAHIGQRIRWARGMVQILRIECPLFASGLKLSQRLCYFNSVVHFLYAFPRLIFLTAPLVYLLLGKSNLYGSLWEILAFALPHLFLSSITNSRVQGSHRHSFWNEVYETILAPYILLPTTLALINPKWGKFNVTSKGSVVDERFFDFKVARPYLVLIALNVIGIALAIPRYLSHGDPTGALVINVTWAVLNTLLLGTTIAVATESRQRRATVRIKANVAAQVILNPQTVHYAKVLDISEGGVALQLQRPTNLRIGAETELALQHGDEGHRFRAEVIAEKSGHLRLRFVSSDLDHYRAITRVIYSRADSWINWTEGQDSDNILQSLVKIFSIGIYGLAGLPALLFKRPKAGDTPKEDLEPVTVSRIRPAVMSGIILLLILVPAFLMRGAEPVFSPKPAQPSTQGARPADSGSFHEKWDLASLGQKTALTLRGVDANTTISLGVPTSKIVGSASLNLRYQVSAGESSPMLDISLNGTAVTSVPLQAGDTPTAISTAQVTLPPDLFVHDNTLALRLRTQCTAPCSAAAVSARWVRIEPSTDVETSGLVLKLPNELSRIPAPFFDASYQRIIELPVAFAEQPGPRMLQAAGVVTSWFGMTADDRGVHCPVSVAEFPHGNVILLATSDSVLARQLNIASSGPAIAIRDNPSDPYSKVLAIIGADENQVLIAARAFALGQFARNGDLAEVNDFHAPPAREAYDAPRWFPTGHLVRIAETLNSGLLRSTVGAPARIYFRLSPDLYFGARDTVPLTLAFRASGLPAETNLQVQVRLNGVFVGARPLKSGAAEMQAQTFAIPGSLLYPSNTLSVELFSADIAASGTVLENASLLVSRSTELDLRGVTHDVRMPRLDLFANSGFPFTKFADLSATAVIMPKRATPAQISTYLDTLGFLGAQTGYPAIRVEVAAAETALAGNQKDLLVIGSSEDQPLFAEFSSYLPILPVAGSFRLSENSDSWEGLRSSDWLSMDNLWQRITSRSWRSTRREERELSNLLAGDTRPYFLVSEFAPSSSDASRTVVVLATATPDINDQLLSKLAGASRNGQIQGSASLLDSDGFHSYRLRPRPYYLTGDDWRASGDYWMSYHLLFIPLFVFACAALLARRWNQFLEKRAQERLQIES